jgi:hypothetical protein
LRFQELGVKDFNSKFFFQKRKKNKMKTIDRVIIEHPLLGDVVNYYVVAQVLWWCR